MAKVLRNFIMAIIFGFNKWIEDLLIVTGLALLVVTTYLVTELEANILAGNYLLGGILLFIGLLLAKR